MNRIGRYSRIVVGLLLLLALSSCGNDIAENLTGIPDGITFNADGTLGLTVNMEIPGMTVVTRSLGKEPDNRNLRLYLLVFEEGEGLRQFMQLAPSEQKFGQQDQIHNHSALVSYDVKLEPTANPTVIHLVVTDQPDFGSSIVYGSEERVMTSLFTTYDDQGEPYGAYWNRCDLQRNIPSASQVAAGDATAADLEAVKAKLSHIPLIRNFCCVSVLNNAQDFTLTGLYVVNTVDRGAVAPYMSDTRQFAEYYDEQSDKYLCKSYDDVSRQGHIGTLPAGVTLINKLGDIKTKSENIEGGSVEPVFFFERPARTTSAERTYTIVRGHRGSNTDRFYKIDLGGIRGSEDDPVGLFEYYNLLRNFDYRIVLNSVEADGYGTLEEAADGVVFNNFSASVEARNMNSISDGGDMIFVNRTSFVFLLPGQEHVLKAQFRKDIATNGEVHNELLSYKWDSNGDVIASISADVDKDPDADAIDDWNLYTVKGKGPDPDGLLKQQTVYIYRGKKEDGTYGLYREITFFSHTPWTFENIDTFPGLWLSPDDMPSWGWSDEYREIGQSKGAPLTLFFELPAGLPQAIFPLEFVIESDRQNIQNAYVGNAVVRSVPASESLFATDPEKGTAPTPVIGEPSTSRIQYVKTVTWEDYYGEVSDELIGTGTSIVRCRFLTITDLAQEGLGDKDKKSTTTLRVYNEYFGKYVGDDQGNGKWLMFHEDGFMRDYKTSDPTPKVWDFASGDNTDGLTINGTYNNGGYYTGVTRFSFSHAYPASIDREAELFVTTSSNTLNVSVSNGASVVEDKVTGEAVPYMHHVVIKIPKNNNANTVTVTTTSANIYKIEYYPRGVSQFEGTPAD